MLNAVISVFALFFAQYGLAAPLNTISSKVADIEVIRPAEEFIDWTPEGLTINDYDFRAVPLLRFRIKVSNCLIDGKPCPLSDRVELALPKGTKGSVNWNLSYTVDGQTKSLMVRVLPLDFPRFTVEGEALSNESLVFSPDGDALIISPKGEIEVFRSYRHSIENFRPQWLKGKLYFSFIKVKQTIPGLTSTGAAVLLDDQLKLIKELPWNIDTHEFLWLGPEHYLFLSYESVHTRGGCEIHASVREMENGKKVFEISSADFLKEGFLYWLLKEFQTPKGRCYELHHLNSLQNFSTDQILVSLGYSGVAMVSRNQRKILWHFGGPKDEFEMSKAMAPLGVHTASWDGSRLLLFVNSWVDSNKTLSNIVEYKLNLEKKTVDQVHFLSPLKFSSTSMGSVESSSGIYSVGTGEHAEGQPAFFEFSGQKVGLHVKFIPRERPVNNYRVYRLRW